MLEARAYMAQPVEGEVTFIYPELKGETRTARVRIAMATVVRPADPECTSRGYERFAGQALAPVQASGEALFALHDGVAHCAVFLRKLLLAGEPDHSAVLSVSSGTCVARGTSAWLDGYYGFPFLSRTGCFG